MKSDPMILFLKSLDHLNEEKEKRNYQRKEEKKGTEEEKEALNLSK